MSEQLTVERLAELRRIAEAATPGPWEVSGPDSGSGDMQHATEVFAQDEYGTELDICLAPGERDPEAESADLEYIARFDPPTVLVLLDEIERLRRERETLAGGLREAEIVLADWCSVDRRDPESAIHDKAPKFVKALTLLDGEKGGGGGGDVMYLTCATFLEAGLITGDCCGSCLSDLENDVAIHCVPCPSFNPDIEAEVCCHHVEAVKSLSAEAWESALRAPGGGER